MTIAELIAELQSLLDGQNKVTPTTTVVATDDSSGYDEDIENVEIRNDYMNEGVKVVSINYRSS